MKFLAASIALAVLATPAWAQTKPDQAETPPPAAAATHNTHVRTTTHTVRHHGTMAKHHWKAKHRSCCNCSCKTKMRHHSKHHVMKKTAASAASKPTTK